jgi:hypothetical protein
MAWKKAVAPVLATLLMIAVAVSMSVIIFMWGQGFLSQTSESTGAQQGAQNQAAQSSIAIESVLFDAANNKTTIVIRNVGAVAISIGSISITGISANAGFTGYITVSIPSSGTIDTNYISKSSGATITVEPDTASSYQNIAKGDSLTVSITASQSGTAANDNDIKSGDVITIKVTTTAGTFAQASYTVP